jgi:predicted amidohydrolase YtcJ
MEQALTAYTAAVAEQAFAGQAGPPWGTIVPGASADVVWLDRDPRTTPALDVPGIQVCATYLRGKQVHPSG